MNLNVKKLRIIAIFLAIALISIFAVISIRSRAMFVDNTPKDYGTILNNNSHIIQYGDNLYYQNEYTDQSGEYKSKLTKLSLKDEVLNPVNLIDFGRESINDNNMFLYDNKIYIVYSGNTYQYDIENNTFSLFCQGILQYFNGESLVFLYSNDLYSAHYKKNTNSIYGINRLTNGNLKRLCEDDKNVYYVSPGHKNNLLIVALDKENFSLTTLSQGESSQNEVIQAITSKNFLYCSIKDENDELHILKINLETLSKEVMRLKGYDSVYLFINDNSDKLYFYGIMSGDNDEKLYTIADDKIKETNEEVRADILKNYSARCDSGMICLYNKGKELGKFSNPIGNDTFLTVEYAYAIKDYLYYMINIKEENNNSTEDEGERISNFEYESINGMMIESKAHKNQKILVRVHKDGGEVQKLNYKNLD